MFGFKADLAIKRAGFNAIVRPVRALFAADPGGQIDDLQKYNFGLLINSKTHTIYRSSALGYEGLEDTWRVLKKCTLPMPKTIIYMNKEGYTWPTTFAIQEYLAQEKYGFRFYHSFGPDHERTYVDGHNPFHPDKNVDKTKYLNEQAERLFPPKDHPAADGGIEIFKRVLEYVLDPNNQPVLFHCLGGRHRTGMMAMAIRYLQDDFWMTGPLKRFLFWKLNPAKYEYTRYNAILARPENWAFMDQLAKEKWFAELKLRYRRALNP